MKKKITLLFVLLICSCLCLTAFAEGEEAKEEANVLDLAAGFITENSAEILSLLTFIGSMVIAFTYKRGLLPKLSSAITGIGGSVGTLKENTEKSIDTIKEDVAIVTDGVAKTEKLCHTLSEKISSLSLALDEIKGERGEAERTKIILASQIDMLYEVFMASALPQYSKDAIFEKISAMRAALTESEKTDG